MSPARRTKQGGSVLVYTVVAIVLGLLVVGAVYTVNKLGNPGAKSGEVAVETDDESTDGATIKPEEVDGPDKSDKSSEKSAKTSQDSTSESNTAADKNKSTESSDNVARKDKSTDEKDTTVETLPQTGPADTVYSLFAVSAVGFAVASYVQSRRSF